MYSVLDEHAYYDYVARRLRRATLNMEHVNKESDTEKSDAHSHFKQGIQDEIECLSSAMKLPIDVELMKRELSFLADHLAGMNKTGDDKPPWSTDKNIKTAKGDMATLILLIQKSMK